MNTSSEQTPKIVRTRIARKRPATSRSRPSDGENWDLRLGFLIHDVSRLRRTVFDEHVESLGVTRSQWWVLAYLGRRDGMIQSDLAEILELGKAALGALVDRLEAAGLVERRADSVDRRVWRVFVTRKSLRLIKRLEQKSHEMSDLILDGLDDEERHELVRLLTVVKTNLRAVRRGNGEESPEPGARR
jgi:MarR family transcriptional regulator, transcriptional regulator for hemolysin